MVTAAAGSVALVIGPMVHQHGVQYILPAVVLAGALVSMITLSRQFDMQVQLLRREDENFRATNSIDLPLIAEMVETEGELNVLKELGIHGAMGRLIGAPAPWQG